MDIHILRQKFCDYSRYFKGYSDFTLKRYKQSICFYSKQMHVDDITKVTDENIRAFFFEGRVRRQWNTNTYLGYYKSLKVFFRWCVKEGLISFNPVDNIELPKPEKRLPPKLTRQEAHRILEISRNYPYPYKFLHYRNHAIFSTFVYAGLRKTELIKLKYTDVDLENLSLFVKQGKGNKDRVIPISYTLADILKRYLQERKRLNKTCPEFFTSLNRNIGITENGLKRIVDKIRQVSGITFTLHKLRHTFATLMLEGGCDIYSLSRMMGHNDIKTTTIYLFASVEHLKSQINKHPLN